MTLRRVDTLSQEILAFGLTRSFKDGPSLLLLLDSPSNPLGNHSSFTHLAVVPSFFNFSFSSFSSFSKVHGKYCMPSTLLCILHRLHCRGRLQSCANALGDVNSLVPHAVQLSHLDCLVPSAPQLSPRVL
ncbi:hypothetical protein LMH87_005982 [Akanthomyces muscarius]|uniref:Uncharacterized protein n=1 Tax=Akanthomyces muscarius TaxID=2231603 RepID=A0A9W8USE5_AKAMU|nr:hypothetical protein LMH87_005982 [Akanthomyces muscarius]KAJ4164305.1 hypothetical protein LMH87_005982 [Akanthomyces muscarius]